MKKKILVAEDSLTIKRVFELTFLGSDYQVTYVDRGEDLLSMARELSPDVIICDGTLPDIDGYSLVSDMKGDPSLEKIPAILLLGSLEPFDEEKYNASGADGLIFKPFESQELLEKVEEIHRHLGEEISVDDREEKVADEDGWDFSDVFEEVELGMEDSAQPSPEEPFISDLVKDEGSQEIGVVEDFDVDIDDIEGTKGEDEELSLEQEGTIDLADTEAEVEESISGDEDIRAIDEMIDDIEMSELVEVDKPEEREPMVTQDEISKPEPSLPGEPGDEESEDLVLKVEDRGEIPMEFGAIDEEDRMMEEVVRNVDEFHISEGYDFIAHKKFHQAMDREEKAEMTQNLEKIAEETLTSGEFRDDMKKVISDLVEKVLWETLPGSIEELKSDFVSSIREVVEASVPEVAREVIQEELAKIREEMEAQS